MSPGRDMAALDLEALAGRGEYVALAALVHHADMEGALGALAAVAREPEALGWVAALLARRLPEEPQPHDQPKQDAYVRELDDNLPKDLGIPEGLRGEVEGFVLTPPPHQEAWPRGEAQARLLRNLGTDDVFALDLAEAVLDEEPYEDVAGAAFALLGRSRDPGRRRVIFERTEDLPDAERMAPLSELSVPLHGAEEARLVELLDGVLPTLAVGVDPHAAEVLRSEARILAGKLSAGGLEEVLRRQAESNGSQQLLSGDSFAARLWPGKLKHLLAADLPQALAEQLVAQAASQMQLDPLIEFGRWAYGRMDAELLSPVLQKVSSQVLHQYDPELRSKCVRALAEFVVRTDNPEVARTLAVNVSPGDLDELPQSLVSSAARALRLGRACASALAEGDEYSEDVTGWLERLAEDPRRDALLAGMEEQVRELELDIDLDPLGPGVLGYPRAAKTLSGMDGGDAAMGAAEESEDPEGQVLWVVEAALEELGEAALETAAERCTWGTLPEEQYLRLVAAYARRPEALLDEANRALASLDLPEAEAIPPRLLRALLGAALEHPVEELTDRLDREPTHYLRQMLDLRGRALHREALRLARSLSPDKDLVGLLVSRRDTMQGLAEPFAQVLGTYAGELIATSTDTSLDAERRVQALKLTARAEPSAARSAAFDLCGANSALIRRAAAEVLATTRSAPEDEPRLRELLDEESDGLAHSNLQAALRNVSSGDVEEAIRNLWHLVGSTPDGTCTAEVLLPNGWRHATFVKCVDQARGRSGGEPSGYVDALVALSELIVETALVARYDATGDPNQSLRENDVEPVYGKTRAEAATKLARAISNRADGLTFDSKNLTVGRYLDAWLRDSVRDTVRLTTFQGYERIVRLHLKPTLENVKLDRLTPLHVRGLYREKLESGLAPRMVQLVHSTLHKALKQAVADGLIPRNATEAVKAPHRVSKEMRPLSPDQARAFLAAARGERLEALFVLALATGMRQGELLGLKWEDVDTEAGTLRVRRTLSTATGEGFSFNPPKTAKSRRSIKAPQLALRSLRRHRAAQFEERTKAPGLREDHGLVFETGVGTPVSRGDLVTRSFKPLLRRAGLPDVRFHDLRHTCATSCSVRAPTSSWCRSCSGTPPWPSPWTRTATCCRAWATASRTRWTRRSADGLQ